MASQIRVKPIIEGKREEQKQNPDLKIHVNESFNQENGEITLKNQQSEKELKEAYYKSETQKLEKKKTTSITPKSAAYKRQRTGYKLEKDKSRDEIEKPPKEKKLWEQEWQEGDEYLEHRVIDGKRKRIVKKLKTGFVFLTQE